MRSRVIREAILEAHQNVEKYGGRWYVLNSDGFDVVMESYFIHEDGTRKAKPFISLYNTEDKFYGNHGMGHSVEYIDGDLKFTSSWDDTKWDDFEQPYGDKVRVDDSNERGIRPIGHVGHGLSYATAMSVANLRHKGHDVVYLDSELDEEKGISFDRLQGMLDFKTNRVFVIDNVNKYFHHDIPVSIKEERFDMASGKMVEDKYQRPMSEAKRKQLRNKRKKRK
jgi:hypothetical protein